MTPTFEQILAAIEGLKPSQTQRSRAVEWFDPQRTVGVAISPARAFELFVRGPALDPASPRVRRAFQHDRWEDEAGVDFSANRLVFDAEGHFGPATAFLAEEFYRNGVVSSAQNALTATEPLIELILRRHSNSHEKSLGLIGELWVLRELVAGADSEADLVWAFDSWKGHSSTARDFELGPGDVLEVKATTGPTSEHRIHGIAQGDPKRDGAGRQQEDFHLVSLGFMEVPRGIEEVSGIGLLREIRDHFARRLGSSQAEAFSQILIQRVRKATSDPATIGNDGTSPDPRLNKAWNLNFIRIYDMSDPAILCLRHAQIEESTLVAPHRIHYDLKLPDSVRHGNPMPDARKWLRSRGRQSG